ELWKRGRGRSRHDKLSGVVIGFAIKLVVQPLGPDYPTVRESNLSASARDPSQMICSSHAAGSEHSGVRYGNVRLHATPRSTRRAVKVHGTYCHSGPAAKRREAVDLRGDDPRRRIDHVGD